MLCSVQSLEFNAIENLRDRLSENYMVKNFINPMNFFEPE